MTAVNTEIAVDVVIFGGGVAGLWLLARLRQQGYQAVLLESQALGAGQTRHAQGIIHGGTKYALTGKLTASSEAVYDMPNIWRDCLDGKGEVDLANASLLSDHQYLWSTASLTSKMAGFFASKVMRGRTQGLKAEQRPDVFQNSDFKGQVYQLEEPVLDVASVIKALAEPHREVIYKIDWPQGVHIDCDKSCGVRLSAENRVLTFQAKKLVLAAGEGNQSLLLALGRNQPEMQRRPLKMVMLRGNLPEMLYAHCMEVSVNPRITITSHRDAQNNIVWYLGGQLAEEGVKRTDAEQVAKAELELKALMPWLDLSRMQWATLDIDRAEPKQKEAKRPASSFVEMHDDVVTAWPTKLALAPKLANDILQLLQQHQVAPSGLSALPQWQQPDYAALPWQEESRWN